MELNTNTLSKLREEYGEAFYLLDSMQFRNNFLELKSTFSSIYPHFNIAYSYKTNYTPKLCRIVNELGGYAEVVSEMEAELAIRVGVKPEMIIWNGPIKNQNKLEEYLLMGVTVNLDSSEECQQVRMIANKYPKKIFSLGIRCNFDVRDGVISRFGFDVNGKAFWDAFDFVINTKNLRLINLQCHFAKRQIDYWTARAEGMVELLDRLNIVPERIDLGGGLFGKMDDSLKDQFNVCIPGYSEYAKAVAVIFAERFANEEKKPQLLIEPGSALVGDCMRFAGTVKTIKSVRNKSIVSIMGSQKNISMSGVNPPIQVFSTSKERQKLMNADLVGYTCIEADVLYKNYTGVLSIGDIVVFGNCGSYSLVMKPPFILPNFAVLDISEGKVELIKRTETFDDLFHTFVF